MEVVTEMTTTTTYRLPDRAYGDKYDGNLDVAEIAKLIRADIKEARKAGDLPDDWKYGVRIARFSGGCSIDVNAKSPRPTLRMNPGMMIAPPDAERDVEVPRPRHYVPYDETAPLPEFITMRLRPGEMYEIMWGDAATDEAKSVTALLKKIVAAYNHDGSDSMVDYFDVKFWGHVNVDTIDGVDRAARPTPPYSVAS